MFIFGMIHMVGSCIIIATIHVIENFIFIILVKI